MRRREKENQKEVKKYDYRNRRGSRETMKKNHEKGDTKEMLMICERKQPLRKRRIRKENKGLKGTNMEEMIHKGKDKGKVGRL